MFRFYDASWKGTWFFGVFFVSVTIFGANSFVFKYQRSDSSLTSSSLYHFGPFRIFEIGSFSLRSSLLSLLSCECVPFNYCAFVNKCVCVCVFIWFISWFHDFCHSITFILGYCHEFVFFPFFCHCISHSMVFESISNDMIFIDISTFCNSWYLYFPFFVVRLLLLLENTIRTPLAFNPVEFFYGIFHPNVSPMIIFRFFLFNIYTSKYLIKYIQWFWIHLLKLSKASPWEFHFECWFPFFLSRFIFRWIARSLSPSLSPALFRKLMLKSKSVCYDRQMNLTWMESTLLCACAFDRMQRNSFLHSTIFIVHLQDAAIYCSLNLWKFVLDFIFPKMLR